MIWWATILCVLIRKRWEDGSLQYQIVVIFHIKNYLYYLMLYQNNEILYSNCQLLEFIDNTLHYLFYSCSFHKLYSPILLIKELHKNDIFYQTWIVDFLIDLQLYVKMLLLHPLRFLWISLWNELRLKINWNILIVFNQRINNLMFKLFSWIN